MTMDTAHHKEAHVDFDSLMKSKDTNELTEGYDSVASFYDKASEADCWFAPAQTAAVIQKLEPNKNARILDVGCGTGLVGKEMWAVGYRNMFGVDISDKSLEVAKEKGVYTELKHATFAPDTPLSYESGYFDMATSTGCFIPNHLNEDHLPEMIRLVKQGGHLMINTRKTFYVNEKPGLKLKTGLLDLVNSKVLEKVSHKDIIYDRDEDMEGIALCYKVL